jgi:hypothetical protein
MPAARVGVTTAPANHAGTVTWLSDMSLVGAVSHAALLIPLPGLAANTTGFAVWLYSPLTLKIRG